MCVRMCVFRLAGQLVVYQLSLIGISFARTSEWCLLLKWSLSLPEENARRVLKCMSNCPPFCWLWSWGIQHFPIYWCVGRYSHPAVGLGMGLSSYTLGMGGCWKCAGAHCVLYCACRNEARCLLAPMLTPPVWTGAWCCTLSICCWQAVTAWSIHWQGQQQCRPPPALVQHHRCTLWTTITKQFCRMCQDGSFTEKLAFVQKGCERSDLIYLGKLVF